MINDVQIRAPHVTATMPMAVINPDFLLERLSADCPPLQFLREFTQNAIEAVREMSDGKGSITWDVAWEHFAQTKVMKLCCIDTGIGMSGPEMTRYIGHLMSTGKVQSNQGNFGVGAKISAVTRNPAGLVYLSWRGGVGHMVQMRYDPEAGFYGLSRWPENGGEFWTVVSDALKPAEIDQHGTMVIFHGMSDEDCTIEPAEGSVPMRSRWVLRSLNQRYFRFPSGLQIRAREGWRRYGNSKHCFLRAVEGQEAWLEANSQAKGIVRLQSATAHWWVIGSDVDRNAGSHAPCGQVAALYQNELYELRAGASARSLLQSFGATFCFERVVIYVEPDICLGHEVSANTARTTLRINDEDIDWSGWAAQFRQALPEPIAQLQHEITARASKHDHTPSILKRISNSPDLYDMRTWYPSRRGTTLISPLPTSSDLAAGCERQLFTQDTASAHDDLGGASHLVLATGPGSSSLSGLNECDGIKDVQFAAAADDDPTNPGARPPSQPRTSIDTGEPGAAVGSGSPPTRRPSRPSRSADFYKQYVIGRDEPGVSRPGQQDIKVTWISVSNGTRQRDDLAERAARFLPEQRHLVVNSDFPIFVQMEDRWQQAYTAVPGSDRVVRQTVREWFETSLLETVVSAQSLKEAGQWSNDELARLCSEEALTSAVLPRWLIDKMIENTLATQMPGMRGAAPGGASA